MRVFPIIVILAASVIALTIFDAGTSLKSAQAGREVEPTPAATDLIEGTPSATVVPDLILTLTWNRLDKPTPIGNSQIDKGAALYWLVCIPCHGDKGQGLTEEWREVFGPEEKNCWQSKCHAANHPPDGFALPHSAPPLLGPGAMLNLKDGVDLHHIIQTSMPWYNPDFINAEDEWNVTAFLLFKSGVMPSTVTLSAANAATFKLRTVAPTKTEERPLTFALAALLGVTVVGLVWRGRHA